MNEDLLCPMVSLAKRCSPGPLNFGQIQWLDKLATKQGESAVITLRAAPVVN